MDYSIPSIIIRTKSNQMLKEIEESRSHFDKDAPIADAFAGIPDPNNEDSVLHKAA
jgi:hypothetical protein